MKERGILASQTGDTCTLNREIFKYGKVMISISYNPGHNIWQKVMKSTKTGKD